MRGHWHGDSQGYRKRWDGVCSGGVPVCPGGTLQSNIHKDARQRRMPDPSVTRRHHNQLRRQGNPRRREVWRVIQGEGKKLSLRWSFKDKLGREFIARWSFKKDCNGT